MQSRKARAKYTVGWIAPMPLELTAAIGMLDKHERHEVDGDDTLYHVGKIGRHYVVMAVCPRIGTQPAATLVANMRRSFPNIRHVLVVGIAGGVPSYGANQEQIVLGDVVVSTPQWGRGGVVHYEFGAWGSGSKLSVSEHTLHPSDALLAAVNNVRSDHEMLEGSRIQQYLVGLRERLHARARPKFKDPGNDDDHLFNGDYPHSDNNRLCEGLCDITYSRSRQDRGSEAMRDKDSPVIHYGTIGSANTLIISSAKRDELYQEYGVICFEMESAGVISNHQALVIRGICDYADSHKNKKWQHYAAATAAAYAKEVLLRVPSGGRSDADSSATHGWRVAPRQTMYDNDDHDDEDGGWDGHEDEDDDGGAFTPTDTQRTARSDVTLHLTGAGNRTWEEMYGSALAKLDYQNAGIRAWEELHGSPSAKLDHHMDGYQNTESVEEPVEEPVEAVDPDSGRERQDNTTIYGSTPRESSPWNPVHVTHNHGKGFLNVNTGSGTQFKNNGTGRQVHRSSSGSGVPSPPRYGNLRDVFK